MMFLRAVIAKPLSHPAALETEGDYAATVVLSAARERPWEPASRGLHAELSNIEGSRVHSIGAMNASGIYLVKGSR
jgi:hypothetical protein